MIARGIGVEGALGADAVAALATLAEEHGYANFWFNVRSPEVDHIRMLELAERRTRAIEIGAGVFPLDEYPAEVLGRNLQQRAGSSPRLIIGIGAGQVREGSLRLVEDGVVRLRSALPATRIAVGAIGRHMMRLAGRIADAVLLNWLTPERLMWARDEIASGASPNRRPPSIFLYHRAVRGAGTAGRIQVEMAQYRQFPHHRRHQAAMGNPELIGIAADDPGEVNAQLRPYAGSCIPVLRPLPADRGNMAEWQSLIRFFAPGT